MSDQWVKERAERLVEAVRETNEHGYPVMEEDECCVAAKVALREARIEERKAIVARLREPDEAMVEAMAEAAFYAHTDGPWAGEAWDELGGYERDIYRDRIAAMSGAIADRIEADTKPMSPPPGPLNP